MSTPVHYHLVAFHEGLAWEWNKLFESIEEVTVSTGDILQHNADAIVSPANSFGYMDGGIDLVYSQHFGWDLEKRLRARLIAEFDGELPVGQATMVETANPGIPWLVSAPTMRVPMRIDDTVNPFLAFRAVLRAVRDFNRTNPDSPIRSVLCPGLGTGEGRVPHDRCAWQMYCAYVAIERGRIETMGGLAGAVRSHIMLLGRSMPEEGQ